MDADAMLYRSKVQRMMLVARSLAEVDLDLGELQNTVSRAHAMGPFIDPTAYMARLDDGSLRVTEDVARILTEAQTQLREVLAPYLATA